MNQIIPILDTLEMAANAPCADENYKKGVTMTLEKAAKAFHTLRVEEIEVLGKPFDPNLMNAVQQVPAQEGQESGTVVTVYQKGYRKLGTRSSAMPPSWGRVVRPVKRSFRDTIAFYA